MNKEFAFWLVTAFVALGAWLKYILRNETHPVMRFYPYVIWTLCAVLYILIPFC